MRRGCLPIFSCPLLFLEVVVCIDLQLVASGMEIYPGTIRETWGFSIKVLDCPCPLPLPVSTRGKMERSGSPLSLVMIKHRSCQSTDPLHLLPPHSLVTKFSPTGDYASQPTGYWVNWHHPLRGDLLPYWCRCIPSSFHSIDAHFDEENDSLDPQYQP